MPVKLQDILTAAVMSVAQDDLVKAEKMFLKIIEEVPDLGEAHYHMGIISERNAKFDDAVKYYENTLGLINEHPQSLVNIGTIHANAGRAKFAVPFFQRALKQLPDMIEAHINLGLCFKAMGETDAARKSFENAEKLDPQMDISKFL